ncbi:MAG: hypothetical protein V1706_17080 [Pseudomonadota bacterium]
MRIYRTPLFNKQLGQLDKSDKKGNLAAARAEEIILHLAVHGLVSPELKNKLTKHGELRMRNCLKYDLGSGYRLIGLKKESGFYLLYVGNHDECDRWLNNKRGSRIEVETADFVFARPLTEADDVEPLAENDIASEADAYEQQLAAQLDEKTLRYVFRGICRN